MELLEGETLAARLARGCGCCPSARRWRRAPDRGRARGRAQAGIVHRDLKPDNIFLVARRRGRRRRAHQAARLRHRQARRRRSAAGIAKTPTGAMMGTPLYMSPEQCRGAGAIDHRADLYCARLHAVTRWCAGGRRSCGRASAELIGMHLHVAPPNTAAMAPGLPAELAAFILSLLAKSADDRPASARPRGDRVLRQARRRRARDSQRRHRVSGDGRRLAAGRSRHAGDRVPADRCRFGAGERSGSGNRVPTDGCWLNAGCGRHACNRARRDDGVVTRNFSVTGGHRGAVDRGTTEAQHAEDAGAAACVANTRDHRCATRASRGGGRRSGMVLLAARTRTARPSRPARIRSVKLSADEVETHLAVVPSKHPDEAPSIEATASMAPGAGVALPTRGDVEDADDRDGCGDDATLRRDRGARRRGARHPGR